jgi:hypothetical protein
MGTTDYYIYPERIVCHVPDPTHKHTVDLYFLGPVCSFWLERQGIPTLHASAIVVRGQGVAFLSNSQGGKSSLAAAFVHAGYPLLTDDILPIERRGGTFVGRPGYPQMRLWRDEAEHFLGHSTDLGRVNPAYPKYRVPVGPGGFGAFCAKPTPLACLYLPERRDPTEWGKAIKISQVSPRDRVIEMVRHSFTARLAEKIGMQPSRLRLFARMVQHVPIRRLVYPSGFEHLPRIQAALLQDLEVLSTAATG